MRRFLTLFVPIIFLCSSGVRAQETTLTVGIPGNIATTNSIAGAISSESLSTAQIDSVLRVVAPGAFGQNFTRDRANKLFNDVDVFRNDLQNSLANVIISSTPSVRQVRSVLIDTNNLNLRLSQKINSVSGRLGALSARVSVVADGFPVVCPTANVNFTINNIMISGDYNYISGDINGTIIDYNLDNISSNCNGFLGFLGDALDAVTGISSSQVKNAVASVANRAIDFANMKRLFSLADFANGINYFRNEVPLSNVANKAISVFREIVNDAAINTPGIVLDFNVTRSTNFVNPNRISIIASSAPVDVEIPGQFGYGEPIEGNLNSSIDQVIDLYYSNNGSNWIYAGTTRTGTQQLSIIPNGSLLIGIGRNPYISGLSSLPGKAGKFSIRQVNCVRRCIVS